MSRKTGIGARPGNGLGVVCFDFNADGWTDVLIANDSMENFLFVNQKGSFRETAISAGVAFGENGEAEAGMGIDAADYDNDGWPDVFITHLDLEFARLYKHNRRDGFEDATFRAGIGYQLYHLSGFGAGLSVKAPGIAAPKGTRAWQIPDCPELTIAAAWRGKLSPLAELVLVGLRKRAKAG